MKDILIRHDGRQFQTRTSWYSPNGARLARTGWVYPPDRQSHSTDDAAAVLRLAAIDVHHEVRITAEAVAIVDAARSTLPADVRSVPLRATTSEAEIAAKLEAKARAAAEKERKAAEKDADLLQHLVGADADAIAGGYEAMAILAHWDGDEATVVNGRGFGSVDTRSGHRLTSLPVGQRTRRDDALALKLARRYAAQLPDAIRRRVREVRP